MFQVTLLVRLFPYREIQISLNSPLIVSRKVTFSLQFHAVFLKIQIKKCITSETVIDYVSKLDLRTRQRD